PHPVFSFALISELDPAFLLSSLICSVFNLGLHSFPTRRSSDLSLCSTRASWGRVLTSSPGSRPSSRLAHIVRHEVTRTTPHRPQAFGKAPRVFSLCVPKPVRGRVADSPALV